MVTQCYFPPEGKLYCNMTLEFILFESDVFSMLLFLKAALNIDNHVLKNTSVVTPRHD
jgi:hypothetical protein